MSVAASTSSLADDDLAKLEVLRAGRRRWVWRPGICTELARQVMEQPERFLNDPTLFYKNSRNVTVTRIPGDTPDRPGLVLRRLNYGKPMQRWGALFGNSRARRAITRSLWLETAGVATARVIAVADEECVLWPPRSYVLSEEIPRPTTLAQFAASSTPAPRDLVTRLAQAIARLHDGNLSHRDLKSSNVLFDAQGWPHLIDMDGVCKVRLAFRHRAIADLSRLAKGIAGKPAVSACHRVLFLKTYCRSRGLDDWRAWWQAIENKMPLAARVSPVK